jgi:hypothetical protein
MSYGASIPMLLARLASMSARFSRAKSQPISRSGSTLGLAVPLTLQVAADDVIE